MSKSIVWPHDRWQYMISFLYIQIHSITFFSVRPGFTRDNEALHILSFIIHFLLPEINRLKKGSVPSLRCYVGDNMKEWMVLRKLFLASVSLPSTCESLVARRDCSTFVIIFHSWLGNTSLRNFPERSKRTIFEPFDPMTHWSSKKSFNQRLGL